MRDNFKDYLNSAPRFMILNMIFVFRHTQIISGLIMINMAEANFAFEIIVNI